MKLQKLCISESMPKELYIRGDAYIEEDTVIVPTEKIVMFNTYFNLFSVNIWRKYTTVEGLSVTVTVTGEGSVALMGFDNDPNQATPLAKVSFDSELPTTLSIAHTSIIELPAHIYISVNAGSHNVRILDILYSSKKDHENPVRTACCFCTYKREAELLKNVNRIKGFDNVEIFIADNGHTLSPEMFKDRLDVHLFQNKNYGGSAGFTRCMIEAILKNNREPFTHVLLMDDDAMIEPYVIEKTLALLSVIKPKYHSKMIGGAMLSMEQPNIQMENGAWINPKSWRIKVPGNNFDLTDCRIILENEKESLVNYNGWFYCCIPTDFITKDNLPLPMFLHADDQEYGIRNGSGVILMNGICVWHPNPWSKKRTYVEYYDARNGMIAMSKTNPKMSWLYVFIRECVTVLRFILSYRYDDAEYTIKGYHDYYKGPEWFMQQDPEKLNAEVIKWKKTKSCKLSKKSIYKSLTKPEEEHESKKVRKILNMLLPAYKGYVVYDTNLPWGCIIPFCVKKIYIVDIETGEGFYLTKSYRRFWDLILKLMKSFVFIFRNHKNIHTEWGICTHKMKTYDYWKQKLELD